jgi:hypothetical protein
MADRNINPGLNYFNPIPGIKVISLTARAAGITSTWINVTPTGIYDITTGSLGIGFRSVAFSLIVFYCFLVTFHTYHLPLNEFERFGFAAGIHQYLHQIEVPIGKNLLFQDSLLI